MLSLNECRKQLGVTAQNFTDEEIRNLRDRLHELADIVLDAWEEGWNESQKAQSESADDDSTPTN